MSLGNSLITRYCLGHQLLPGDMTAHGLVLSVERDPTMWPVADDSCHTYAVNLLYEGVVKTRHFWHDAKVLRMQREGEE